MYGSFKMSPKRRHLSDLYESKKVDIGRLCIRVYRYPTENALLGDVFLLCRICSRHILKSAQGLINIFRP